MFRTSAAVVISIYAVRAALFCVTIKYFPPAHTQRLQQPSAATRRYGRMQFVFLPCRVRNQSGWRLESAVLQPVRLMCRARCIARFVEHNAALDP
jgi:hypothetical protein